jgi:hypothetical protein
MDEFTVRCAVSSSGRVYAYVPQSSHVSFFLSTVVIGVLQCVQKRLACSFVQSVPDALMSLRLLEHLFMTFVSGNPSFDSGQFCVS